MEPSSFRGFSRKGTEAEATMENLAGRGAVTGETEVAEKEVVEGARAEPEKAETKATMVG